MKIATRNQKAVDKLIELASENNLSENADKRGEGLIAEIKRLVDDDECSSSTLLNYIEYNMVAHEFPWGKERTFGFKLKGTDVLLSDAMEAFENLISKVLPQPVRDYYPELSHEQWQAAIRMTIDVITLLDRRVIEE
ncbi:MAG: hypothetical protein QOC96_3452 [Acidobacteriota bacterium]|jgi:hypothetical protein|nr:hypothetical protein [Acidobacteriota bacterium]